MNDVLHVLHEIGFTRGEQLVYVALLKLGRSTLGPLVKESGISRSKVSDVLDRLVKKGMVSKCRQKKGTEYQALPPEALLNYITSRQTALEQEKKLLQKTLPLFALLHSQATVNVMVYEGFEGFKAMIDRAVHELTKKDVYLAMGISETTEAMRHYARKIYDAQSEKKYMARTIFDEQGAYKAQERANHRHEIRILPKGWHTPALFTVYGSTTGLHLGKGETIISVVIQNKEIADSFRAAFEAMWQISSRL